MIILSILVTLLIPLLVLVVVPYLFISFDLAIFPQALGVWEIIAILLILLGLILVVWVGVAYARDGRKLPGAI